jgi:hypothetical protein
MRDFRFGIEIETVGQTREAVARAIQTVVGGEVRYAGAGYDAWEVKDATGRVWKAMSDGSLSGGYRSAEVVSPILVYADIEKVQEVVRALRKAGAKVDTSCGIHIHVDAARFDGKGLVNLAKLVHQQEELIVQALAIQQRRLARFTRMLPTDFIERLERERPRTKEDLNRLWYGSHNHRPAHYDESRYHGLNLHSVWYRGTIEFRWFEATLHAGQVKAYIQFCLALCAKALKAKAAAARKRQINAASGRYDFRVLLLRLGMIGDEFKTARQHLLANLQGSTAWKNGRPEGETDAA